MKNKKFFILLIIILIIIIFFIFKITNKFNNNTTNSTDNTQYLDYTPEEEISENQMRETTVSLYFLDPETNKLKTEGRLVDSKLLLSNPYKELVELLLTGPKTSTLKNVFPENTRLIDATYEKNSVILSFSQELLNFENDAQKYNMINSLLNTLTALNEVDSFKILINNDDTKIFNEKYSL